MSQTLQVDSPEAAATDQSIGEAAVQAQVHSRFPAPDWIAQIRTKSWERFVSLPDPKRSDEAWRFADFRKIKYQHYQPHIEVPQAQRQSIIDRSDFLQRTAARLVFANDQLLAAEELPEDIRKQGVLFSPLSEAWTEHQDLVRKFFMAQPCTLGSEKFAALHAAYVNNGAFLFVPDGVEIAAPIVVHYWNYGANSATFPHTLIALGKNASATLIEVYHSSDADSDQFSLGCSDLHADKGAKLNHRSVQILNENSRSIHLSNAVAEADAEINTIALNLGCMWHRAEKHVRIAGPGSKVDMDSLAVTTGKQEIDQRTLQTHAAPGAVSDLLFKNALLGESRTIFSGLIKVDAIAQQTDAYQTNRNLLLNTTAEANSLPGLEIEANDVKCSHGATTGQLDTSELFYMLSRGIPEAVAYQLLVFGFFEEVLLKITDEEQAQAMRDLLHAKFDAAQSAET